MSESVERRRRRKSSAEELRSVTRNIKGLAAVNVRHFEQAAGVIDAYQSVMERGLQIVLRDRGSWPALEPVRPEVTQTLVIVFGSAQGLCGPINRRVASHTQQHIAATTVTV